MHCLFVAMNKVVGIITDNLVIINFESMFFYRIFDASYYIKALL